MDSQLTSVLRDHPALKINKDGNRVQLPSEVSELRYVVDIEEITCSLTGHEMPLRLDAVQTYITNKKYKRLCDVQLSVAYEKYKEHLIPSNKEDYKNQLFCLLTLRHLTNGRRHIEQHIAGRRFQKAYARWLHCQETGEKFVARTGRRSKRIDDDDDVRSSASKKKSHSDKMWSPEDGDGEDDDVSDTFSDLYPAADFEQLDLNDEWSDYELEEMDDDTPGNSKKRALSKPAAAAKNKKVSVQGKRENVNKRRTSQKKPKFLKENKAKKPKI